MDEGFKTKTKGAFKVLGNTLSYLFLPDGRSPVMDIINSEPILRASIFFAHPEISGADDLAREFLAATEQAQNHIITNSLHSLGAALSRISNKELRNTVFICILIAQGLTPGDVKAQQLQAFGGVSISQDEQKDLIGAFIRKTEARVQAIQSDAWRNTLGMKVLSDKSFKCIVDNIYHEGRGESVAGQKGVMAITLNRAKRAAEKLALPDAEEAICGVVYEPRQFSWTMDPKLVAAQKDKKAEDNIKKMVDGISQGKPFQEITNNLNSELGITDGTLFYVRTDFLYEGAKFGGQTISPASAKFFGKLEAVATIGKHTFFKVPEKKSPATRPEQSLSNPAAWADSLERFRGR